MSFGELLWYTIAIFFFVAFLMVLFYIFADLFRDQDLSGWGKAVWILALIFFTWIAALIYLIARGKGMAERNVKAAKEMQEAQNTYIRDVARRFHSRPDPQGQGTARLGCDLAGRVRQHQGEGTRLASWLMQNTEAPPMWRCLGVLSSNGSDSVRPARPNP